MTSLLDILPHLKLSSFFISGKIWSYLRDWCIIISLSLDNSLSLLSLADLVLLKFFPAIPLVRLFNSAMLCSMAASTAGSARSPTTFSLLSLLFALPPFFCSCRLSVALSSLPYLFPCSTFASPPSLFQHPSMYLH